MDIPQLRQRLLELVEPGFADKIGQFGIDNSTALGIRTPLLKALAKELGKQPALSAQAWNEPEHEMKLMAILLGEGKTMEREELEKWVRESYSWDLVDQACGRVYQRHPDAWDLAFEWARREPEMERRAGLVLMIAITIHHKKRPDETLLPFFEEVHTYACDDRNFVKKANNWLLRTLGKRSLTLNPIAIEVSRKLVAMDCKAARWTGMDALRELEGEAVQERLRKQAERRQKKK